MAADPPLPAPTSPHTVPPDPKRGGRNGYLTDPTRTLLQVAATIAGTERLEDLLPALARAAAEAVDGDQASVYVYDATRERTVATGHYATSRSDPLDLEVLTTIEALDDLPPTGLPAEAEVIRTRRPLLRDASTPFPDVVKTIPWRSDVIVPLLAQGEVHGVLYVREMTRERIFDADDLALLDAIGRQAGLAVLRARDAAAAARRADHLAILSETGQALAPSLQEDDLCARVHDQVRRVLPVDAFLVGLVDAERQELRFLYLYDAGQRWPARTTPIDFGQAGHAVRTGLPHLIGGGGAPIGPNESRFGDPTHRSQSAVFVPMRHDGRVIGVLSAQRYDTAAYDEDDLRTLETIAQQAAAAFAHAHLFAETVAAHRTAQRQAADLEAVLAITRAIASAPDLATMLATFADAVGRLVPHDELVLFRLRQVGDEERLVPILMRRRDAEIARRGWWIKPGQGLVGRAFVAGEALCVNDAHLDPRSYYQPEVADGTPYRTTGEHALVVPLLVAGQPVGVLFLNRVGGVPFTPEEFATFRALAEETPVAIRNAALLDEAREARERAARHAANLETTLRIARSIGATPGFTAKLDVLAAELETLVPHDGFYVYRLMADGTALQPTYVRDRYTEREAAGADAWRLRLGEGLIGQTAVGGRAELVNDAHLDPRACYPVDPERWRHRPTHAMTAPLLVDGRLTGVLFIDRVEREPFAEEEFTLFRILAEHTAIALNTAALLDETQSAHARTARHAANLEAVLATTRAITARLELSATFAALADHLERLIPHDRFTIWRLDESSDTFSATFNRVNGQAMPLELRLPRQIGDINSIHGEPQVELANDDHLRRQWLAEHDPWRADRPAHKLMAALTFDGRAIGTMALVRYGEVPFDEQDLEIFQVMAGQAEVATQASLLYEEERRRRRFASALAEVATAINQATTLDELVHQIAAAAAGAVGVDHCSLYVYDETATRTVIWYHHGYQDASEPVTWESLPPTHFPVEQEVIATGRPVAGARLRELFAQQPAVNPQGQRGGAALPLRVRGSVQGALYVWSGRDQDLTQPPYDFDADEIALLAALGDQAGVAIERARLYAETERHVAQLRAVAGVNAAITRQLELNAMLEEAMASLRETVRSSWGVVTLWDEATDALHIVSAWGPGADAYTGLHLPLERSINGLVYRTGEPVNGDADSLPAFRPPSGDQLGRYVLCVPLRIEGRTIGTIEALRDEPGPFTADDLILYELLAGQLAVGIERARIYQVAVAARERSEREARTRESVLAANLELARQTDLSSTLRAVGDGLARLIPYAACAIRRYEETTGQLRLLHSQLGGPGFLPPPAFERIAVGQGIAGLAFATLEPLCLANAQDDPRLNRAVWEDGPEARAALASGLHMIAVPLLVEGTALGVLAILRFGPDPGPFSEDEFTAARLFAGQAAAAIRTAELVSQNRDLYLGGIRALASAVDQKDQYTRGHSERVSAYARRIADALDLAQDEAEVVELAALLHDIGKIGIPDKILQKAGALSPSERAVMMSHAGIGARMLADAGAGALQPLVPLVHHHHEHVDGRGYPFGLSGDNIPLGSAIIAVADAFDTMVTDRPYRGRRPVDEALEELHRCAGAQFRSDVVTALAGVIAADATLPERLEAASTEDPADAPDEPVGTAPLDFDRRSGRGGTGLMGDPRPLRLLVELAGMTRLMPDLETYLHHVAAALHRLDYDDVMLFLVDQERAVLRLAAHAGSLRRAEIGLQQPIGRGNAGAVARDGTPRNIADVRLQAGTETTWPEARGSELVMPLIVETTTIGVLSVASATEAAFSRTDETVLSLIAEQVAIAVHVAQLHADARRAAITDGLTGLLNHRAFYEELERAVASGESLGVVLFDVEGLKAANDSAGHLAGDALLRRVADTIRANVRPDDVVARYGGDEFAAILRGVDLPTAEALAGRIRERLLASADAVGPLRTTVRYGAAVLPEDGTSPYDLVGVADRRLYEMRARLAAHDRPTRVPRPA